MNVIVPDQILDTMVCSKCSKYLSVLPVHMYPNGEKKCGRCIEEGDHGMPSQVNKVFPTMLFKCSNRYEGCTDLLLPEQVTDHEKSCVSRYFDTCPLCPDLKMPPYTYIYMMVEHFKKRYRHYFLKKPTFQINVNIESDNYYLYIAEDMVFMLNVLVDTTRHRIFLDNRLLGSKTMAKKINQQFRIQDITTELKPCKTTLEGSFFIPIDKIKKQGIISCELILKFDVVKFGVVKKNSTTNPQCSVAEINKNNVSGDNSTADDKSILKSCEGEQNNYKLNHSCNYYKSHYYRKLYLSEVFKKLYPNYKLSACEMFITDGDDTYILFCSFCGGDLYPNPYYSYNLCSVSTASCGFCKNHVKTTCSKRHSLTGSLRYKQFQAVVRAYCKWNCGQHFNYFDLHIHEMDCISRDPIPSCPVQECTAGNFKNFSELEEHFKLHKNTILTPYCDNITWAGEINGEEFYLFQDHVTVVFSGNNKTIKLTNVIQNDECKLKIFVNETQIALNQEIKFVCGDILWFRVIEEHVVTCNN
ncbi:unnamed protein product [Brassicogethes aeneus]|uniref:Uncharacterized protein n=1 Tax=Brassicogethes aeneus TaxID=1431903 RepID=A0A9P0AUG0_BRAAE|nr:unnamed protein product [Brassicogethes aeneus]